MSSMRILPLLTLVPLLGCDSAGDWLRGPGAAAAYAAPLASDTTVVTTRRVWSSSVPKTGAGSFDLATVMEDGAGLVTTDWETGDPAIFDLASREFRRFRLNNEPYDEGLALPTVVSPDGSQIVFMWYHRGPEDQLPIVDLRVLDVATGESRMVMAVDSATQESLWPLAWSSSGDSVFAVISEREHPSELQLLLIPVEGGTRRTVHRIPLSTGPWGVTLSPDGRWLLYEHALSRNQQPSTDVYIVDLQSGGAGPLVEHRALDRLVGWLPGTDIVLFASDRSGTMDLWSVRVVDGRASAEPRLVRSGFFRSQAVGFGDGALFYKVETGASGTAVINVDPESGALLGPASPPLDHLNTLPRAQAWSPDGQTLAAPTRRRGSRGVTLHSMETGDSRVFWMDEAIYPLGIAWAADGKSLFVRVAEAGVVARGPHHFLRLDLVTGTTTRLFAAEDPEEPSTIWDFLATPDGRSIVLRQQLTFEDGGSGMKLVLRSLEDGSEKELYSNAGFIPELSISADGTELAFVHQVWEKSDSLFIMRMDGSGAVRSVTGWDYDTVGLLGWLPGGNALLTARLTEDGSGEEVLRVELDGSTTVVGISPFAPKRGQPVQGYNRTRLVLSPAGNRLAHHVDEAGEELWRMDGLHELFAPVASGRR